MKTKSFCSWASKKLAYGHNLTDVMGTTIEDFFTTKVLFTSVILHVKYLTVTSLSCCNLIFI